MKILMLFLISFNLMAATFEGSVDLTGTSHRQITTFDISGEAGALPETYQVQLMVKDYDKLSDGSVRVKGKKRYNFTVGSLLLDSEGNPIAERVTLMNDFTDLFYVEIAAQDASPSGK